MEMAGIVCYTGAKIIQNARKLVEKIGLLVPYIFWLAGLQYQQRTQRHCFYTSFNASFASFKVLIDYYVCEGYIDSSSMLNVAYLSNKLQFTRVCAASATDVVSVVDGFDLE